MRSLLLVSSIVLALATTDAHDKPQAGSRKDRSETKQKGDDKNTIVWQHSTTGFGLDVTNAGRIAKQLAYEAVLDYLERNHPTLTRKLSMELLEKLGVIGPPSKREPSEQPGRNMVVVEVKITAGNLAALQDNERIYREEDRLIRARERNWLWGKLLLGTVGLLLIVTGYYRLEEMTKGYYTTRLRVVAITGSVLVSIIVVVLLIV